MPVEETKARMRRVAELVKTGDLRIVDEFVAPEFVRHDLSGGPDLKGPDGVKLIVAGLRAAFPDIEMVIEDVIAEGDKVVVRYTARGTHLGQFSGLAPTGKQVTWAGINIYRGENGKAVETWQLADRLGMMQQMGIIPPMGQAGG